MCSSHQPLEGADSGPAHGTIARAKGRNYLCRCELCLAAANERDKAWRNGPGRSTVLESNRKYRQARPERWRAWRAVQRAVEAGQLVKPDRCACGKASRIHAHHDDYSAPLKVRWLCPICHKARHRELELNGVRP